MTTEAPDAQGTVARIEKLEKRGSRLWFGMIGCMVLLTAWIFLSTEISVRMADYVRILETRVSNLERFDRLGNVRGATDGR